MAASVRVTVRRGCCQRVALGEVAVRSLDGLLRLPVMGEHDDRGAGHHPGHGRGVVHGCRGQPAGVVGVLERPGYPVGVLALRGCLVLEFFADFADSLACGGELAGLGEGLVQVVAGAGGFGGEPVDVG